MAKLGFAMCLVKSIGVGHTYSGLFERDCDRFEPTTDEIAKERLAFVNRKAPY